MSNLLDASIKNILKPSPKGKTLIIAVGNTLRRDDGIGSYIVQKLKPAAGINILNAGDRPEDAIDEALKIRPAKTIIIDAADFGGKTGEARVIDQAHIPEATLSTHTFPVKIIAGMIEQDTGSKVYFLGIQPKSVELGQGLSRQVQETGNEIIKEVNNACTKCI